MKRPPFSSIPVSLAAALGFGLWAGPLAAGDGDESAPVAAVPKLEFIDLATLAPIMTSVETADPGELDNEMVCERRRPTGTRIARETCHARDASAKPDGPQRRQMLDDLQQMRDTQRLRDLANQNAFQEAFRQRAAAAGSR